MRIFWIKDVLLNAFLVICDQLRRIPQLRGLDFPLIAVSEAFETMTGFKRRSLWETFGKPSVAISLSSSEL